jgi:hypothetical protein
LRCCCGLNSWQFSSNLHSTQERVFDDAWEMLRLSLCCLLSREFHWLCSFLNVAQSNSAQREILFTENFPHVHVYKFQKFLVEKSSFAFLKHFCCPLPPFVQMMFGIYVATYTEKEKKGFVWICNECSLLNNYFSCLGKRFSNSSERKDKKNSRKTYFIGFPLQIKRYIEEDIFLMLYWCFYNKLHFCLCCGFHLISLLADSLEFNFDLSMWFEKCGSTVDMDK